MGSLICFLVTLTLRPYNKSQTAKYRDFACSFNTVVVSAYSITIISQHVELRFSPQIAILELSAADDFANLIGSWNTEVVRFILIQMFVNSLIVERSRVFT